LLQLAHDRSSIESLARKPRIFSLVAPKSLIVLRMPSVVG
jgi:hypothetical protein